MRLLSWAGLFLALCIGRVADAQQLIVETSGTPTFNAGIFENHPLEGTQTLAASWTHAGTLLDASVIVTLLGPASDSFTAYLTKDVGPGTSVADQVATATLPGPGNGQENVRIFSNLSLLAGRYYIVLAQSPGTIGWHGSTSATVTTAPGAIYHDSFFSFGGDYPPGRTFLPMGSSQTLLFRVEGVIVPEPGSIAMLVLAGGVIALIRRRSRS